MHNTYHIAEENKRIFNTKTLLLLTLVEIKVLLYLKEQFENSCNDTVVVKPSECVSLTQLSMKHVRKEFVKQTENKTLVKVGNDFYKINVERWKELYYNKLDNLSRQETVEPTTLDNLSRVSSSFYNKLDNLSRSQASTSINKVPAYNSLENNKCLKEYNSLNSLENNSTVKSTISPGVIGEKNESGCNNSTSSKINSMPKQNTKTTIDNILTSPSQDLSGIESKIRKLWDRSNKPQQAVPSKHPPQISKQDITQARPQSEAVKCPVSYDTFKAKLESYKKCQPGRQAVPESIIKESPQPGLPVPSKGEPVEVTVSPNVSPVEVAVSLDELKRTRVQLLTELKKCREEMMPGLNKTEMKYRYLHHEELSKQVLELENRIRRISLPVKTKEERLNEFDLTFAV